MFGVTQHIGFMAGGVPNCDPYWNDVMLLMHGDEPVGTTTLVDEKSHVVNNSGIAHVSSTPLFTGANTLAFDNGDSFAVPFFSSNSLVTGDWTIELAFYLDEIDPSGAALFAGVDSSHFNAFVYGTDTIIFEYQSSSPTQLVVDTNTDLRDAWHRFALVRDGTTLRMFLDGIQIGSATGFSGNLKTSAGGLKFGTFGGYAPNYDFTGQMAEIRITDSVARYTGDYAVATGPFPDTGCV